MSNCGQNLNAHIILLVKHQWRSSKMKKQKKTGKQTRNKKLLSTKAGTATSSPEDIQHPLKKNL